jgi:hypothetical protein
MAFFETKEVNNSNALFHYSEEMEHIIRTVLLDRDCYAEDNNSTDPASLLYVLCKWIEGKWNTYQAEDVTLVKYASKLINEYYTRIHGESLDSLEYYQEAFKEEWIPGTDHIPNALSDAVNTLLLVPCPSLGENINFIQLFFRVASGPILCHLHNYLAEMSLRRKKPSCNVM